MCHRTDTSTKHRELIKDDKQIFLMRSVACEPECDNITNFTFALLI